MSVHLCVLRFKRGAMIWLGVSWAFEEVTPLLSTHFTSMITTVEKEACELVLCLTPSPPTLFSPEPVFYFVLGISK